jgi:hypothetical protein
MARLTTFSLDTGSSMESEAVYKVPGWFFIGTVPITAACATSTIAPSVPD